MFSWLWRWHRECLSLKKKKKQNPLCVVICSEIVLLCHAVKHFSLLICLFVYTLFFSSRLPTKPKERKLSTSTACQRTCRNSFRRKWMPTISVRCVQGLGCSLRVSLFYVQAQLTSNNIFLSEYVQSRLERSEQEGIWPENRCNSHQSCQSCQAGGKWRKSSWWSPVCDLWAGGLVIQVTTSAVLDGKQARLKLFWKESCLNRSEILLGIRICITFIDLF